MVYKVSRRSKFNWRLFLPLLILVALIVVAVLELTNTTHLLHKAPVPPHTASEFTKGEPLTTKKTSGNSSTTPTTNGNTSSKDATSSKDTVLIEPTGNFVSSHHISLSRNDQESSTCNTTPGASCTIKFSQGGITKSLPTKTADSGGASTWSWTPSSLGLTTGSWKITAVASLGSQQSSADDALALEIGQ